MSALKLIEENPGVALGVVVVVVLLLTMRSGGSGPSAQAMINAQLKAQEIASKTDVALSGQNAQLAATRTKVIGDVYKTQIVQGAQYAVAKDTNTTRTVLGLATEQNRTRQIDAQLQAQTQTIAANRATAAQALNTQLRINQDNIDMKNYQLDRTIDMRNYQLPIALQGQQNLAQINSSAAQAIAAIQVGPAQTQANTAAQSSSSSSALGWVGTLASLFF